MTVFEVLRTVRWYLRELTGESQYERYLKHHQEQHLDGPPLTRREFERQRVDRGDEQPGARCC